MSPAGGERGGESDRRGVGEREGDARPVDTAEPSPPPRERIRRLGLTLGLDALGFAPAEATPRTRFLRTWLDHGYVGEMH